MEPKYIWLILFGSFLIVFVAFDMLQKYIKGLSKKKRPTPFEKVAFYVGLGINVPLSGIAIYSLIISQKSLDIAQAAYLDTQKSGPIQQAALEGSRRALEYTVEILKKQQISSDSSRVALEYLNRSTLEQQKVLRKNLSVSQSQFEILNLEKEDKNSVERNKLGITIIKINSFIENSEFPIFEWNGRSYRPDWIANTIILFESELNNSLLIRDKEAFLHWQMAIELLRKEPIAQSDTVLEKTVVVNGSRAIRSYEDAEKILTKQFKLTIEEGMFNEVCHFLKS